MEETPRSKPPAPDAERRVRRISAAVLILACALVALSCAQAAYQLWLPTEGWDYTDGETVDQFGRVIFTQNLLGSPSPIQPGDLLLAVNGLPPVAPGSTLLGGGRRESDTWRVGQAVQYRVERSGRPLDLEITLKSWTAPIIVGYLARNEPALWLSGIFLFGLSTFVLLRRPDEPAARPLLLLALGSVAHAALTKRDSVSRAQLRWGFGGFLVAIILFLPQYLVVFGALNDAPSALQALFTDVASVGSGLAFPVFSCCIAVAILRYRLFDIDVIIRRTLVYAVLTVALGAVYLVSVVALQALFVRLTGQTSTLAVVASTLAIAALFQPLRRRVQALIDRRFFRKKYDAAKVLEQFAQRVQQQADLDALAADIVGVVHETMQPEQVQLWLVSSKERQ